MHGNILERMLAKLLYDDRRYFIMDLLSRCNSSGDLFIKREHLQPFYEEIKEYSETSRHGQLAANKAYAMLCVVHSFMMDAFENLLHEKPTKEEDKEE